MGDELEKHAIPFITAPDDDGGAGVMSKFEVNPDAVAYLESLKGKVAVVGVYSARLHAHSRPRHRSPPPPPTPLHTMHTLYLGSQIY